MAVVAGEWTVYVFITVPPPRLWFRQVLTMVLPLTTRVVGFLVSIPFLVTMTIGLYSPLTKLTLRLTM